MKLLLRSSLLFSISTFLAISDALPSVHGLHETGKMDIVRRAPANNKSSSPPPQEQKTNDPSAEDRPLYGYDDILALSTSPGIMYHKHPDYPSKSQLEVFVDMHKQSWFMLFQVTDPRLRDRNQWESDEIEVERVRQSGLKAFFTACRKASKGSWDALRKDDPSHHGKLLVYDMGTLGLDGYEIEKTGLMVATCNLRVIEDCPDSDLNCNVLDLHDYTAQALKVMNAGGVKLTVVTKVTSYAAAQAAAQSFVGGTGASEQGGTGGTGKSKKGTKPVKKGGKNMTTDTGAETGSEADVGPQ